MNAPRRFVPVMVLAMVCPWPVRAQSAATPLVGTWTLNKDLSDSPADRSGEDGRDDGERGRRGGGFGRGGFGGGRGGVRRGGRGGGRGGDDTGRGAFDPEQVARQREAMRDILVAPAHLTIVRTETMIIVTTGEGRTTRLSPDGRRIKDESTKTERKTRWDAGKLVSELSGLATGKVVETYAVDPERRQLHVTVQTERGRSPVTLNRIYDAD